MKSQPEVNVIVCTKNNQDIISKCLDSIKNQTYKKIKCIVVDDNSTDKTKEIIKKYPKINCIKTTENKGPSYNRNIAIKKCSGKYIITMDSDAILKKNWVELMVKLMEENENIGIASGKILFADRKDIINMAGGGMNCIGLPRHFGAGEERNLPEFNKQKKCLYLCSASMIIRKSTLDKIGLFDEEYFYGYEDLDLCWRANLAGFEVIYHPKPESYHETNNTINKIPSQKITFIGNRNRLLTLLKNYSRKKIIICSPLILAHMTYLLLFRRNKKAIISAYIWPIKNLKKVLKKRKEISNIRK